MDDSFRAVDLIEMVCQDLKVFHNKWDLDYLQDASEKGISEFGEACHLVFGKNLSRVLFGAIQDAHNSNQFIYTQMSDGLDEKEARVTASLARDQAIACKVILEIQRTLMCDFAKDSEELAQKTDEYAEAISLKLNHSRIKPEVE